MQGKPQPVRLPKLLFNPSPATETNDADTAFEEHGYHLRTLNPVRSYTLVK